MNELLQGAVTPLLTWYDLHKRDLPWRKDKQPYHVWISEIMLQQTRVEAVKEYYLRFLQKFPTVLDLASAEEDEVLKAWEGLGYYSRARNLHKAAKAIAERGAFPTAWEEVRALAGIGDYTAGAICSIAYDLPRPAVDGNVLRILTRLLADGSNIDDLATRRRFAEALKEVYPARAGDFCQALMELGAIVCVPNGAPLCGECPWNALCRAHLEGREEQFPVRNEKTVRRVCEYSVFVYECNGTYALEKRENKGLLAGMWQFPMGAGAPTVGEVVGKKTAKHIFTHVEWKMTGYLVKVSAPFGNFIWANREEIAQKYAVPSAFKAFLSWVK